MASGLCTMGLRHDIWKDGASQQCCVKSSFILSILRPQKELNPVFLVLGTEGSEKVANLLVGSFNLPISLWVIS